MPSADYAVILSARMGSSRLHGKALAELAPGVTVLEQISRRWLCSARRPAVVITTWDTPENDPIAAAGERLGLPVSRGRPGNPVAEIDQAIHRYTPGARYVARALADNPLIDVDLADWRLDKLAEAGADGLWYGAERDSAGRWRGLHERITYAGTTDVWSRQLWDQIAAASSGSQLEHPGAYFWDTELYRFEYKVRLLPLPRAEYVSLSLDEAPVRTELDEAADLAAYRTIWSAWEQAGHAGDSVVPTLWALRYLAEHPEVAALNRGVALKTQSQIGRRPSRHAYYCNDCHAEAGQISDHGLELRCQRCGKTRVFTHQNPRR